MVRLAECKDKTEHKPIEVLLLPKKVYIPLSQHLGKICVPEVKVGDLVVRGQLIASAQAHVHARVHASISGKVTAIQDWPHPVLGRCKAIVIEGDGSDKLSSPSRITQAEVDSFSAEQIRNIIFEAGIVGMGGASFPTHIKLNPPKPVDTLIVNGAECEPFLNSDNRLMIEKAKEIIAGIKLVAKCVGAKNVYIAIEDNKPEAIKQFQSICDKRYAISILKSQYPQGGEKQLIKNVLRKEVPRGKLPFDIAVVVQNVATIYAIYEALYLAKPLYERTVTVTGSCIDNPKNLLVPIGTPIKELINYCGPITTKPAKIIIGGPMMGLAQFTDEVPVIKSTGGVLLFSEKEARVLEEEFCIRCGACVRECPAGLMPCLINLSSEKSLWQQAKDYGVADCIECGICNYVCPAKRRLVQTVKRAKLEIAK
ncbi:MAG: electron transport complex subunit RsxC [Candidatus Omnitrophica bacterium]|nr:electron transport complex subunit RsxC [Candidatus Omnitrophota bacterium]